MIRRLVSALGLAWALGLALFASTLPRPAGEIATDGIVALTGGPGRIQRGLDLLRRGRARRMLISGADRRVRPVELAARYQVPLRLFDRVDLGAESVDTRSNADETGAWVQRHGFRSIRLVTTDWHMRRARLELARVLPPEVDIVADAVQSEPGLGTLVAEYDKYLLRRAISLAHR